MIKCFLLNFRSFHIMGRMIKCRMCVFSDMVFLKEKKKAIFARVDCESESIVDLFKIRMDTKLQNNHFKIILLMKILNGNHRKNRNK